MSGMGVAFGVVIGLALGLTGGGGSIFAVPLLVYGMGVGAREAIGVSLAAVGTTSLIGAVGRLRAGEVDVARALFFSLGGIVGAPLGSWLGTLVPDMALLTAFAALMVVTAVNLWRKPTRAPARPGDGGVQPATTPRRILLLAAAGLLTGILAGLFGVGGGFVIVPALVFCAGMPIHRAVASSLLAIALISAAGVTSHLLAGHPLPWDVAVLFILGGVAGMAAGTALRQRLSPRRLQRVFAGAILGVAAFVLVRATF